MTPTRDRAAGPQPDPGTGSPMTSRPSAWAPIPYEDAPADYGTASPFAVRPYVFDGDYFIPPLWL